MILINILKTNNSILIKKSFNLMVYWNKKCSSFEGEAKCPCNGSTKLKRTDSKQIRPQSLVLYAHKKKHLDIKANIKHDITTFFY